MRRSAILIPSNIAEGGSRSTKKDFVQFLHITQSSVAELETQLVIAKQLYPQKEGYNKSEASLLEINRMLKVMINKLKA